MRRGSPRGVKHHGWGMGLGVIKTPLPGLFYWKIGFDAWFVRSVLPTIISRQPHTFNDYRKLTRNQMNITKSFQGFFFPVVIMG